MRATNKQEITIIGCGLAGSFLAILLTQRGHRVQMYEKLSRKEICDSNSKRSYNITFLAYGIDMLKTAKVFQILKPHMIPLKGVSTQLSKTSKPIFTPTYDKKEQYYAVSRATLLDIMLKQLERNELVTMHYNTTLLSIDRHERTITIQDNTTGESTTVGYQVIIGADGANSLVRAFIQQGQHTHHQQKYANGGYKQFTITKEQVKKLQLQEHIAYTWSADQKFILAFPNFDGSLASLLIYPNKKSSLLALKSPDDVKKLIREDFPLLQPIEEALAVQLRENPVGTFVTIHTAPWYYKDRMALVGDAAHGFYPFFGQGTSAAFGDCLTLVNLLDQYGPDWQTVFSVYQQKRKRHMDTLGELSKEGLSRYARNKRADYPAIYDKLELIGYTLLPGYIQPPVLLPVMNDPDHTDDYVRRHNRQRAIFRFLGIPLLVLLLTKMVAVYERIQKIMYR